MAKTIVGVMGAGDGATDENIEQAKKLGKLIARKDWIVLTGGRNVGVMEAASRGAKQAGGTTVGILPSKGRTGMSEFVDIPICTGMGSARNNINILSSDVVVACGSGAGTISEIMLTLKVRKPLVLLNPSQKLTDLIDGLPHSAPHITTSLEEVIRIIQNLL